VARPSRPTTTSFATLDGGAASVTQKRLRPRGDDSREVGRTSAAGGGRRRRALRCCRLPVAAQRRGLHGTCGRRCAQRHYPARDDQVTSPNSRSSTST
jgi:hypothetical protein